ncbi:MAG: DUF1080 domain-containing protein [Verrucomicrobiae bacterium]|nr:DUF1080 domain-containing protein [Verrucomicrobiae bacterium]NNJ87453.1 DUF1080 domain-containing protein [Akkermansiaceae bacterium]
MKPTSLILAALMTASLTPACFAEDFKPLFNADLSNATYPEGIWSRDADGVLTASKDQIIWSKADYQNFILRLEFKNGEGTNSGVFVYASDTDAWVTDSVEIQIADDFADKWANKDRSWQCGSFFGRQGAYARAVKKPGEWNRMTIVCSGPMITVHLNGVRVNTFDLRDFTSAMTNPNGSNVPRWLKKAPATLPRKGKIGFQGKHGGAPIYLRNIEVMPL